MISASACPWALALPWNRVAAVKLKRMESGPIQWNHCCPLLNGWRHVNFTKYPLFLTQELDRKVCSWTKPNHPRFWPKPNNRREWNPAFSQLREGIFGELQQLLLSSLAWHPKCFVLVRALNKTRYCDHAVFLNWIFFIHHQLFISLLKQSNGTRILK